MISYPLSSYRATLLRRCLAPTLTAVSGVLFALQPALASPIQYVLQGTFSGTLGSTPFSDTKGTFRFTGDSNNVTAEAGGFSNVLGTSTFQLSDGQIATFQSPSFGVESQYGVAAFMDELVGFAVGEYNEATPEDVLSHPGPVYAGDYVALDIPAATNLGSLTLTNGQDVSFQAIEPAALAPEPASLLLLATGLVTCSLALKRKANSTC